MRQLHLTNTFQPSRLLIGKGLLNDSKVIHEALSGMNYHQVVVISNRTVLQHIDKSFLTALGNHQVYCIEDGEQYKNLESLNGVYNFLLSNNYGRDTLICALGGGVVGDLAGFVAATYQRGIQLIQVPTTLLAQVDSSVGGKTAINHPLGKNMIGAFYQPRLVFIDSNVLTTLPKREILAGLAEVVKYALIGDKEFFHWLTSNNEKLLELDSDALDNAIYTSCHHKIKIVSSDEREKGKRMLLNLGHTFGHAIESYTQYTSWLHGEAVALGMRMAAEVSHSIGWLKQNELQELTKLLNSFDFPQYLPQGLGVEKMIELMKRDKKNAASNIRLILLKGIGKAEICDEISTDELTKILKEVFPAFKQK